MVTVARDDGNTARSTVAIPLHKSMDWIDRIEANIRVLSPVANVLVSDVSHCDEALATLRERIGTNPRVRWLTATHVPAGWVAHCNWLLDQADTEYFMWLSHDDVVSASWVTEAESALDANSGAVLAAGALIGVRGDGRSREELTLDYAAAEAEQRVSSALHNLFVGHRDGLGHSFRGLVRRSMSLPLPVIDAGGTKADMYWALSLLVRGPFLRVDAEYEKEWHSSSASAAWLPITISPDFRNRLSAALVELPERVRERVLLEAWTNEALTLRETIAAQRVTISHLRYGRGGLLRRLGAMVRRRLQR